MFKSLPMFAFLAVVVSVSLAHASIDARYRLHDHPDGGAQDPLYGLRLDGLYSLDTSHIYTFSFDQSGAAMFLDYDSSAGTLRIHGQVYGGRDIGSDWDASSVGLWEVDFTYRENVGIDSRAIADGDNDYEVSGDDADNNGTITPLFGTNANVAIDLVDEQGKHSFSFRFNDLDENRLHPTGDANNGEFEGWGWLNHSGEDHIYSSDWLFTGEIVPEASSWLIWGGLAMMGVCVTWKKRYRR